MIPKHKLYIKPAARYSEDINLVQIKSAPIGELKLTPLNTFIFMILLIMNFPLLIPGSLGNQHYALIN